ncbi:hypothetical protein [Thiorhodococcus fuscus]|uniref:Uncharacterized protein n=1 Tax=Thiorhodococcus fuscus TaxID=527200 RepID=A0ABW4Y536_9GAMM
MTYVYQWFGAVTGYAFLYGCMLGMTSQMMRQAANPLYLPRSTGAVSKTASNDPAADPQPHR